MIRKRKTRRGQIAILLALSFSIIFLLIAMVINISFLVTAKINLQNSVDLAAYAGAAQQARYLTEIGKWNYEMRRNYKAMVFDYVIALNSERKPDDFKKYMNNDPTNRSPIACASLQRQKGDITDRSRRSRKITCQNIKPKDFHRPITTANNMLALVVGGCADICTGAGVTSAACLSCLLGVTSQIAVAESAEELADIYRDEFTNYFDKDYNYNRRLIAWMMHDYRHLQTRIRGVHFGGIKIRDRWDLAKQHPIPPVIFKNSPMSVAAKVINGYTDLDAPPSTDPTLDLMKNYVIKNPAHNAAMKTFENNLIKVISRGRRLFHLKPNIALQSGPEMSEGCGGNCNEFNGPYLKLHHHDVEFPVWYFITKPAGSNKYTCSINKPLQKVTNFPVGVAKDARIMTYYALIGVADTKNIPFNVFFGSGDTSQNPPLVAVAAARPFGSRIGPYINDKCKNLYETPNCTLNGSDPLYPYKTRVGAPNFSVREEDKDIKRLGVKITVSLQEYRKSSPRYADYIKLYAKTDGKYSRWRDYTQEGLGHYKFDDGFDDADKTVNDRVNDPKFFDYDGNNRPVHPMGNRNSVIAWHLNPTIKVPHDAAEKDSYEGYLAGNHGKAIHQFDPAAERETKDGKPYRVYTFKYPSPRRSTDEWDIERLTIGRGLTNYMEKAFAGTMAVNEFEIKRYILPHRSITLDIPPNVLNWSSTKLPGGGTALPFNPDIMVYSGAKNRGDSPHGEGNKSFADNYVKYEPTSGVPGDSLDRDRNRFPESYTSWRIGSRGYRVKIVNIQDLIKGTFNNKLKPTYTISYGDKNIRIDLDKIYY